MKLLTVASCFYRIHHDIFRCHERKLAHKPFGNDLFIYYKTIYHIQAQIQNAVRRQKSFRYGKPLVGRIIQCSFKPLGGGSNGRI